MISLDSVTLVLHILTISRIAPEQSGDCKQPPRS